MCLKALLQKPLSPLETEKAKLAGQRNQKDVYVIQCANNIAHILHIPYSQTMYAWTKKYADE